MTTVNDLRDGDTFSLDGGTTWHVCAVVLDGRVAVYTGPDRGPESEVVYVRVERRTPVLVR